MVGDNDHLRQFAWAFSLLGGGVGRHSQADMLDRKWLGRPNLQRNNDFISQYRNIVRNGCKMMFFFLSVLEA